MIYKTKISKKKYSDKIIGNIIFLIPFMLTTIAQSYPLENYLILIFLIIICELISFAFSFFINKINTPKSTYNFEYYREYGFNSPPAIVARFFQQNKTDENDLLATILDLSIRGYINIDNSTSPYIEKTLNETNTLKISLNTNKSLDSLLPFEKYIIKWFFCNSNTNYISLKNYLKNDMFSGDNFKTWQSLVENEFLVRQYTCEENKSYQNFVEFLIIPIIFINLFSFLTIIYKIPFIIFVILSIILTFCIQFLFNISTNFLTQKGIDELEKIKGYIKFIKDFSLLKDSPSDSVTIWNQYLTYSIALNLTEKINKDFKKIIGEELYINKINYD